MLEGMYAAASGMDAQQQQLDAIGNDLANAQTTGYKAERVGFHDLLYSQINQAGTLTSAGAGAAAEVIGRNQAQGTIQETGNPLDLAIEGEGYFTVKRADGSTALTRDGAFELDANGQLMTAEGDLVQPPITLPSGVSPSALTVGPDGTVRAGTRTLGKLTLVTVASPDHLLAQGAGLYAATASSGSPQPAGAGKVHQGALESSNVDVATEMVAMVNTQRSYQLESSAIQTENQMLSIANQLRS
ncbi:MAG TPA: flagellar hook-basal body protein [Solirubrobacteraceae bacterium]|nr:flagellar hook-basal body protein [Solirubrobacteraceae bacterium]